jgi:CRP/FNR family transcriptional regulator, cyclic AMP receptor protein
MLQRPTGVVEPLPLLVLRPGHTPVHQGEPGRGLYVVESGLLRAVAVSSDGHELVLDLLGPGDLVGELEGSRAACTVRALRPTRLRPVASADAAALLAARARRAAALACDLAWHDVSTRVERRLQDLAARHGIAVHGGTVIPIALTQEDVAGLAGTSRESANRAIRGLLARDRLRRHRRGRYVVRPPLRLVRS